MAASNSGECVADDLYYMPNYIVDQYAQPDTTSQTRAGVQAESLLRQAKPDGSLPNGSCARVNPASR